MRQIKKHGSLYSYRLGCRCDPCKAEQARRRSPAKPRSERPARPKDIQRQAVLLRKKQTQSTGTAKNSGKRWTGPEMEMVVTRRDLSDMELAEALGRTLHSVQAMRKRATRDPKYMKAAGVEDA